MKKIFLPLIVVSFAHMLQAELPIVSNHKESSPENVSPALGSSSRVACDIGKVMEGSPRTRDEVIKNRIWGDEREPELWGTGKEIPLNELPTLWREACWYAFAKWWWTTNDGQLFFIMEDNWNSKPVYDLHVYKLSSNKKEFFPLGTIKLKGLKDNGIAEDAVIYTDGTIIFSPNGYLPIKQKIEDFSPKKPITISFAPKEIVND